MGGEVRVFGLSDGCILLGEFEQFFKRCFPQRLDYRPQCDRPGDLAWVSLIDGFGLFLGGHLANSFWANKAIASGRVSAKTGSTHLS